VQRWRLIVARRALDADSGQREQLAAWELALTRSGLPVAGLDAVPPRPRVVMAAPLAASMEGDAELFDAWLTARLPAWQVRETLASSLPAGYRLVDLHDVWLGAPALPGQVAASVYRAMLPAGVVASDALASCDALLTARALPRERVKGGGTVTYDLRPFIEALDVRDGETSDGDPAVVLRMTLRHDPEKGVGRPDEVLDAIGDALGRPGALRAAEVVRERLVLAPSPAPAAQPGPRPPRQPGSPSSRARR
jgi:radical SAM-linked protein